MKLSNGNTGHAHVIGVILCNFITFQLYIRCDQFIIVQATLPTPYHQFPLNFILVFKKVASEPLDHCGFVDPQGCSLEITLPDSKQYRPSSNRKFQIQLSKKH